MPVYKNICRTEQRFRAADKVYTCAPGKTVEIPVEIAAQCMEKVKGEDTKRKK